MSDISSFIISVNPSVKVAKLKHTMENLYLMISGDKVCDFLVYFIHENQRKSFVNVSFFDKYLK